MSYITNLEDKRRLYKKEKKIILGKFWDTKYNCIPEGMHEKTIYYKRKMKNLVDNLLEIDTKKKRKSLKLRSMKYKNLFSTNSMNNISPKAQSLITKIGRNYNKVKNSISDITKMNSLYLEKNARRTCDNLTSIKQIKNLKKIDIKNELILENLNENNIDKKDNTIYKKIKKPTLNNINEGENKYLNNFFYVNENYRRQFNFAFLKYNPKNHLENLKILVQTEPLIRKDVTTVKKEINEDIKWRCDKQHFKKKYEILKKKFQRCNSVQASPEFKLDQKNKNKPKLNIKEIAKSLKIFSPIFSEKKILNIYNRMKKEQESKLAFLREKKIEELKCMINASSGINELINDNNINKKIDLFSSNYSPHVKLNENNGVNNINLLGKDYFDEEKKNALNKLGTIYEYKISNILKAQEKERRYNGKIVGDNNVFNLKLIEEKNDLINELDDKIKGNVL